MDHTTTACQRVVRHLCAVAKRRGFVTKSKLYMGIFDSPRKRVVRVSLMTHLPNRQRCLKGWRVLPLAGQGHGR